MTAAQLASVRAVREAVRAPQDYTRRGSGLYVRERQRIVRASSAHWFRPASFGGAAVVPAPQGSEATTVIYRNNVSNYLSAGSPAGFYVGGSANMSDDGVNVITTTPSGLTVGQAPVDMYANGGSLDSYKGPVWYLAVDGWKVSSNWWAPTSTKTFGFFQIGDDGSNKRCIFRQWRNGDTGPITIGFAIQNEISGPGDLNYDSGFEIVPGVSYNLRYKMFNNSAGVANGGGTLTINGAQVLSITTIQWTTGAENFNNWEYTPILGGVGGTNPNTFTQQWSEARVEVPA